jgi:hypothetical protein
MEKSAPKRLQDFVSRTRLWVVPHPVVVFRPKVEVPRRLLALSWLERSLSRVIAVVNKETDADRYLCLVLLNDSDN